MSLSDHTPLGFQGESDFNFRTKAHSEITAGFTLTAQTTRGAQDTTRPAGLTQRRAIPVIPVTVTTYKAPLKTLYCTAVLVPLKYSRKQRTNRIFITKPGVPLLRTKS